MDLFEELVAPDAPSPTPTIEIRSSTKRRKTIAAHWEGDKIVVVVPHRLSKRDQRVYADELAAKLIASRERSRPTDDALASRAALLSAQYLDGRAVPASVEWSTRQQRQWGSCTAADRSIRLSERLKGVPDWVLDAVLLHELAHLLHCDHGPEFQSLIDRFPRNAEADAFLEGLAFGLDRSTL